MKRIFLMMSALFLVASCGNGTETPVDDASTTSESEEINLEEEVVAEADTSEPIEVEMLVFTKGETMTEMAYEPARLEVPAGSLVTITLENKATSEAMIHNIVFIKRGKQEEVCTAGLEAGPEKEYIPENENIIAATSLAGPGETVEVEFTAPKEKGTYQYVCTYPGHTAMKGILLVK